jgi:hypothetical protein
MSWAVACVTQALGLQRRAPARRMRREGRTYERARRRTRRKGKTQVQKAKGKTGKTKSAPWAATVITL